MIEKHNSPPSSFSHEDVKNEHPLWWKSNRCWRIYLKREPLPLPLLEITKKPFWELTFDDFSLHHYEHHPVIQFPVAI